MELPMIITMSTDTIGYTWEAEVLFFNLIKDHNYPPEKITWLTYSDIGKPSEQSLLIKDKYGINHIHYKDERIKKNYPTSIRLWMWNKYLIEDSCRQERDYLYIDTDIIFNELPDFSKINVSSNNWYGANTNYYTSPNSIMSKGGLKLLQVILDATNNSLIDVYEHEGNSAGAQWYISKPTPELFMDAYLASEKIYDSIIEYDSKYKKMAWISDMWALLWTLKKHGITAHISKELDFSMPHQNIVKYNDKKIYHNSGFELLDFNRNIVTFNKSQWRNTTPEGKTIFVSPDLCSYKYVLALQKTFPTITIREVI